MSSPTWEAGLGQVARGGVGVLAGTIGDAVAAAAERLGASGVEQADCEAWLLLAHVLADGWPGIRLRRAEELAPAAARHFAALVERRAAREPLQYITDETEFMGLKLKCRPGVLIPRPETEVLVECVLNHAQRWDRVVAADVGCGSGNIACALAHLLAHVHVEAIDCDPAAVELTRENAAALGLGARVRCHQGRFLEPLPSEERRRLNCVVCNPPYVARGDCARLQPEVLREPPRALDGGEDGLDFYRAFIPSLGDVGYDRLLVAFEVGKGQARTVERMLAAEASMVWTDVRRDYAGIERVVLGGTEEAR